MSRVTVQAARTERGRGVRGGMEGEKTEVPSWAAIFHPAFHTPMTGVVCLYVHVCDPRARSEGIISSLLVRERPPPPPFLFRIPLCLVNLLGTQFNSDDYGMIDKQNYRKWSSF